MQGPMLWKAGERAQRCEPTQQPTQQHKGCPVQICMLRATRSPAFFTLPRCVLRSTACYSCEVSIPSLRTVS